MNEEVVARKKRKPSPPRGAGAKKSRRFSPEQKLRAVRLRLEEGFGLKDVCAEVGVAQSNLSRWIRQYQECGQVGLQHRESGSREDRLPAPITEKILELKKENPGFGIKRISQLLRRWFFLPASPETVRQRLHEAQLMPPTAPPKKRNMVRPRFFERATPNQMWQSDIFTFRLGGRYAYLIAFMDDYSRFIVGADLFRSPTANAVIEVYRVAAGEYQPPKEMLTDNGRQYTSWRGTSRFEAELKKDHVAHFKSRPHHPMTLGKVERFWSTIWQDFLVRAQFESFDSARERIKLWIKHYNHRRPNQGIEGLCPADRFFEIQSELRKTIETGIQDNLLELALRGKPQSPFYMVGRMDGQSVVLRAEKGKLKLSVSDQQNNEQELTYDLSKNDSQRNDSPQKANPQSPAPCPGQSSGSAGGVDRTLQTGRSVPPVEHQLDHLQPLAASGDGGNAPGAGEPCQLDQGGSLESPASGLAPKPMPECNRSQIDQSPGTNKQDCQPPGQCGKNGVDERQSQATGGDHLQSPLRPDECHCGGTGAGDQPPAVLSVGTTGTASDALVVGRPSDGASGTANGPGEGRSSKPGETTGRGGATIPAAGTVAPNPEPLGAEQRSAAQ
jgi:transposase InsO family protein